MFHLRKPVRRRSLGPGTSAVVWGAAFFLGGQLAIWLALINWPPQRDPEYDLRLKSLHARMAERPARRPVLFLGSSRVGCTVRPGLLPVNQANGDGPVLFNFGVCCSGPVMELLCLRRLIADGVTPKCVFVEVWPAITAWNATSQMSVVAPERLRWSDASLLRRLTKNPQYEFLHCLESQIASHLTFQKQLLQQWALSGHPLTKTPNLAVDGLDGWGWLSVPFMKATDEAARSARVKETGNGYIPAGNSFAVSDDSLHAYKELFALCRLNNITVGLVAMPDDFLPNYSSVGRRNMDEFMCSLSQDNNVALIDARAWAAPEDFFDGVHLTQDGSALFTMRFGREVLDPFLSGEPLTRRWPPGQLDTTPSSPAPSAHAQSIAEE